MNEEQISENIISLLAVSDKALRINEIARNIGIRSEDDEYTLIKEVLQELIISDIIEKHSRKRFSLKDHIPPSEIEGMLKIVNGRGIVETGIDGFREVVVKRRDLSTALDGDFVRVNLLGARRGKKPKGEIIDILKRSNSSIVGTLEHDGTYYFLIPDEEKYMVDFLVPSKSLKGAKDGDKVVAKFLKWVDEHKSPVASIKEIIGKAGVPEVEYESIVTEFDLPQKFPIDVIKHAKKSRLPQNRKTYKSRVDLRDIDIITIDPEDAKDFDDALSLEILDNGNFYLGVHIADVSHYVPENSDIDNEARYRGTSIYLVDKVIPMLPEELSNEICSLKPDEVRLAHSVFVEVTPRGVPKNYKISETVIRSKRRFTYEEVLDIIDNEEGDYSELILSLHILASKLKERRFRMGGIDFKTSEVKYILNENKFPVEARLKTTTKSTSLVEECMLLANQVVAGHVAKISKEKGLGFELPFIYRVHEEPNPRVIGETAEFINSIGYKFYRKNIKSRDINRLLHEINGKPEENIVNQILIRSMPKAIYSKTNVGHFGLGFKEYTHFTSPIRRYPDLLVHRLIKEYSGKLPTAKRIQELSGMLNLYAKHSSDRERLAIEAERASNKLVQAVMSQTKIGEEFDGTITGVTSYGLFVQVDGIYAEGLLHIRDLIGDYYYFDDKRYRLIGRRSKKTFTLGTRLRVKIIKVNIKKREIDLAYVGSAGQ